MRDIQRGTTTYEQMPREFRSGEHPAAHKPWVWILIALVIILFGAFWYIESRQQVSTDIPLVAAPVPAPAPVVSDAQPVDLATLQTAVINSAIPDYSKDF